MNCLMLDDEPLALKILENYAAQLPSLHPRGFFTNPQLALQVLHQEQIDLLFLDIHMPDVNGLKFFQNLKQKPLVIFSTAFRDYAVESFELSAIDYIVKPYEFDRFQKAVAKANEYYLFKKNKQTKHHLFVYSSYRLVKILIDDIYLIETQDDYLKIHLQSKKKGIYTLMTMKEITSLLPAQLFLRVHRSYMVSIAHIQSIRGRKMVVHHQEIPIGPTYLKQVRERIMK
ncbi:MAG: LytTR family DNA-binding domain-containing protein [Bacteroidota bacterium]